MYPMLLVSEGERTIRFCGILSSESEGSSIGYGYNVERDNNQETQEKGLSREINFASSIKDNYSEAGAITHLKKSKLVEDVQRVFLALANFNSENAIFVSGRCDNVLKESGTFVFVRRKTEEVINVVHAKKLNYRDLQGNFSKFIQLLFCYDECYADIIRTWRHEYRSLKRIICFANRNELDINFLMYPMLFVSEGERTIRFYGILPSEGDSSSIEYGYNVEKDNNQET
jgi:hypothetical protein